MARRVFLHIGTPKSGTTYLQSLWWQHRDALAGRGLLLPGGDADEQFRAGAVVRANAGVLATMGPRERGAWDRVAQESAAWSGDVLVSQEQLVEASAEQASAAVGRLADDGAEVHLVITARDLVRQVPSAWQQRVKHGSDTTLRRFCRRVAKDDPGFNFWHHQDVPRVLDRWAVALPPEHVHVVVLPRPGADRDLLWRRTSELLGLDAVGLATAAPVANETLAPAEIEFLRQVNTHFPGAHLDVATSRRVKGFMEPRLGRAGRAPARLLLPADLHPWFVERGNAMVDELASAPWHVVGDLEDLRPDPEQGAGVDPDAVPDADVLEVATAFIAAELQARASGPPRAAPAPASPRAVRGAGPGPREPASPTTLRRVLRRLTRGGA
ncbi:MAG: hypothetical protein AVDCRST_MAG36-491 [uncultured Nocardioidaceae bacterium]|uniref:Sulfotransferase family protein n=1 Tax=uncultured Nocardioidaceae bacterium TaxID=253824 RepID=A0A6J4L2E1_9ACTN|nr:MAG: hypothetical protein AVDCRST_MAG36-491 [uncultured Nocardioidaceae bacterium]